MGIELQVIEKYVLQAMNEFETNPLASKFLRRMLNAEPDLFCSVALSHLNSNESSAAHRLLAILLLHHEDLLNRLTSAAFATADAVKLFKRFQAIDPLFDVRLARKLPSRNYGDHAIAFDSPHSARALDILDQTSHGRRLLPILGHLPESADFRIAAKATLFVGKRVQNPAWTRRQLERNDQRVRANAVEALWGITTSPAIHLLEDCVHDPNNRVVGNSLVGLYIAGNEKTQKDVISLSKAGKSESRFTAAWVMGRLGIPSFKPRLTELVRDEYPPVRSAALRALICIRGCEVATLDTIEAQSAAQPTQDIEKTVEKAIADIYAPSMPGMPELRLDGSSFSTPTRR